MRYVFREILLVVVGILIALQIKNLNNFVKNRLTTLQLRIDDIAQDDLNLVRFTKGSKTRLDVNIERKPENNYSEILKRPKVRNLMAMKLLLTADVMEFRIDLQKEIDRIIELIEIELGAF